LENHVKPPATVAVADANFTAANQLDRARQKVANEPVGLFCVDGKTLDRRARKVEFRQLS
jgi:hypothetical protein